MHRFFVDKQNIHEEEQMIIVDDKEDVIHISKVLRLKTKDQIEICDGTQNEYIVEISEIEKSKIVSKILSYKEIGTEPKVQVSLYQGVPKGSKMELIIQKCTEVGIATITPIITDRTVVQLKDKKAEEKKTERWKKIAEEAAKQCKRGRIPSVMEPISFLDMLKDTQQYDLSMIPYENEALLGLKKILRSNPQTQKIAIVIGPEGGFEESEILAAKNAGIIPVTLGPRILRTETAGFIALGIVMYELGDIGGII